MRGTSFSRWTSTRFRPPPLLLPSRLRLLLETVASHPGVGSLVVSESCCALCGQSCKSLSCGENFGSRPNIWPRELAAAAAIICHREGGGGGVGAAASSRLQILASQSKMAARAPIRAPACHSSPACRPDTEGGAHSSTWAIICHREGGGGGVGAAASSRLQILASRSKMAARAPSRAPACLSSPAYHPDTEHR